MDRITATVYLGNSPNTPGPCIMARTETGRAYPVHYRTDSPSTRLTDSEAFGVHTIAANAWFAMDFQFIFEVDPHTERVFPVWDYREAQRFSAWLATRLPWKQEEK